MMLYIVEVNNIVFCAAYVDGMFVIVDFLFHLRKEEDQQDEDC